MLSSHGGRGGWLIEATDCGAGVGRTSEALLLRFAERVDLVEQSRKLLNVAKESIGPLALRRAFEEPLQVRLFAYPLVFLHGSRRFLRTFDPRREYTTWSLSNG